MEKKSKVNQLATEKPCGSKYYENGKEYKFGEALRIEAKLQQEGFRTGHEARLPGSDLVRVWFTTDKGGER